jgi:uncharacterized protein with von Willebrand factor type A (vWA) domain
MARPKPVTRKEVLDLAVTDADAFTAMRYLRHRETVPSLPDLEEQGRKTLPGVEGSLLDLYHSLWAPEPGMREEVPSDRKYWATLLAETMKSSVYGELHAQTQLQELQSVMGTVAMGETVLSLVPKEDQEKLQEQAEAQQQADALQQQAQQAQAQAQAMQAVSADATVSASGQGTGKEGQPSDSQSPSTGSGSMSAEQAQAIADQLAQQAAQAQARAEALQGQADQAKAQADQLAQDLLGEPGSQQAQDKLRELTRIGLQAARKAQEKVEEVSETIEAWGLEEGELTRQGLPEAMAILERMKRNEALKKFASLLGRIRKIAARKAKSKMAGEGARVVTVETGRDLKRAQRTELIALTDPALRVKALQRWTRGELRLQGQKTKQRLGYGPVIVCEDGSGSMEGEKQQWAKAVTLSLAHYAKLQKRSFGWILFDYGVRQARVYLQGQMTAQQLLELVESRAGGGTDFERPLRKAVEMIQKEGLKKADVCFVTDGECAVSKDFVRWLKAVKKELEISIYVVLCDVGSSSNSAVREFADKVEVVSKFTEETASNAIFSHF